LPESIEPSIRNLINYINMDNRQSLMEIIELPFHVKTRFEFRCTCYTRAHGGVATRRSCAQTQIRRVSVVKSTKMEHFVVVLLLESLSPHSEIRLVFSSSFLSHVLLTTFSINSFQFRPTFAVFSFPLPLFPDLSSWSPIVISVFLAFFSFHFLGICSLC